MSSSSFSISSSSSSVTPSKRKRTKDMNDEQDRYKGVDYIWRIRIIKDAEIRNLRKLCNTLRMDRIALYMLPELSHSNIRLLKKLSDEFYNTKERLNRLEKEMDGLLFKLKQLQSLTAITQVCLVCVLEPFKYVGLVKLRICFSDMDMFPNNTLGGYVLDRRRVVDIVVDEVSRQEVFHKADSRSVYLCGCRAMGKTCTLALIGDEFLKMNYSVYFFRSLFYLEANMVRRIQQLLKDETKTIVILVDGVESDSGHGQLKELLKMSNPRLITIGAAVPLSSETANTGNFRYKIQTSDLVLKRTDTDYIEFVRAISESVVKKAHPITSYQECSDICDFVLTYCGGHVYPTLDLISYFFTLSSFEHLQSVAVFQHYLFSQEFENNEDLADIKNRCFDHDTNYDDSIDRLMRGVALEGDLAVVIRLGWWNKDTNGLISTMLRNYWLNFFSKRSETTSTSSNAVAVLTAEFSEMTADENQ